MVLDENAYYYVLAATTATLHIEHSIRGLNRNVAILFNMLTRSREAIVTPRRRGVAASNY